MTASLNILWGIFAALSLAAVVIDARTYKIPNMLVAVMALVGFLALVWFIPAAILAHLGVALGALAAGYLLFLFTGFGAGDAKLVSAVMLWFGVSGVIPFLFWFGVCCAVLVLILVIGRRLVKPDFVWRPLQKGAPVPLALAIGPAALIASTQFSNGLW